MAEREDLPIEKQQRIEAGLVRYLNEIEKLGIVSGVLVSSKEGKGFIWNVFSQDFHLAQSASPHFQELSLLIYQLEQDLSCVTPLRISNVSPTRLEELKKVCSFMGMETELVYFKQEGK